MTQWMATYIFNSIWIFNNKFIEFVFMELWPPCSCNDIGAAACVDKSVCLFRYLTYLRPWTPGGHSLCEILWIACRKRKKVGWEKMRVDLGIVESTIYSQYVRCWLGSDLSSQLTKFINSNTELICILLLFMCDFFFKLINFFDRSCDCVMCLCGVSTNYMVNLTIPHIY